MAIGGGLTIKISVDTREARKHAAQLGVDIRAIAIPKILDACGLQVMNWGFEDYRARSNRQEAGGEIWKEITDEAIESRLRKRAPWKALVRERKSLKGRKDDAAKAQRKKITTKQRAMVASEFATSKIGVDTGRLANALQFGKRDNVKKKTRLSITVGVKDSPKNRGFDRLRKIFGRGFMDLRRQKKLDEIGQRVLDGVIKRVYGAEFKPRVRRAAN